MEKQHLRAMPLSFILAVAILFGLQPMSHQMSAMDALPMEQMRASDLGVSLSSADRANRAKTSESCCAAMSAFSLACDFLVSQFVFVARASGAERVAHPIPVTKSIHIEGPGATSQSLNNFDFSISRPESSRSVLSDLLGKAAPMSS